MQKVNDLHVRFDGGKLCLAEFLHEERVVKFESKRFRVRVGQYLNAPGNASVVPHLLVLHPLQYSFGVRNYPNHPPTILGKLPRHIDAIEVGGFVAQPTFKMNCDAHLDAASMDRRIPRLVPRWR